MVVDFLKIVQEYVMLGVFSTQEDLLSLVAYMHQKFVNEVQLEAHWAQKQDGYAGDVDQEEPLEGSIYEKKLNLLAVGHLVL